MPTLSRTWSFSQGPKSFSQGATRGDGYLSSTHRIFEPPFQMPLTHLSSESPESPEWHLRMLANNTWLQQVLLTSTFILQAHYNHHTILPHMLDASPHCYLVMSNKTLSEGLYHLEKEGGWVSHMHIHIHKHFHKAQNVFSPAALNGGG